MRVSRMLTLATLGVSMAGCGFATGSSHHTTGRRANGCTGDEVLEVFNPFVQNVDIYAMTGNESSQFFTTAPRGRSTIPLTGTAYEHSYVGFMARVGSELAQDVRITRRCEQRSN